MQVDTTELVRPLFRGVSHQWTAIVAVAAGLALVASSPAGEARWAVGIYAASLVGMLAASALYHRVSWSPRGDAFARRLDHSMIFVLVAGTYTPFAVIVMDGPLADAVLIAAWTGALAGVAFTVAFTNPPIWLRSSLYVILGWASLVAAPQILDHAGAGALGLMLFGGVLYTLGAVVYVRRRPDPVPEVFGFHEIFHGFVVAAAAVQFAAIAFYVIPVA